MGKLAAFPARWAVLVCTFALSTLATGNRSPPTATGMGMGTL